MTFIWRVCDVWGCVEVTVSEAVTVTSWRVCMSGRFTLSIVYHCHVCNISLWCAYHQQCYNA
jgi:hypothetical protein